MRVFKIQLDRTKKPGRGIYGFTIIELMITVSILAILMAVAVPSMQELIRKNRMNSESQRLVGLLSQARNAALTTNRPAFVCRHNATAGDGSAIGSENFRCLTAGLDQLDWSTDILVYSQLPGAITAAPNSRFSNQRIQRLTVDATGNKQSLRREMVSTVSEKPRTSVVATGNRNDLVIRFNSDGTLENSAPFRIAVCDDGDDPAKYGRIIEIGAAGQIRSSRIEVTDTDRDCTPSVNT